MRALQAAGGTSLTDPTGEQGGDRTGDPGGEVAAPARPVSRGRVGILAAVAAAVLGLDLLGKTLAVAYLSGGGQVRLLDGLLVLRLVRNPGAAFGLGTGVTVVFTLVAVAVVVVILRTARRLRSRAWAVALGLLLGGALGNLTDRVFRSPGPLRGHVVDYLELPRWPVFNLADSAIVTAALLMVLLSVRGRQLDGTVRG